MPAFCVVMADLWTQAGAQRRGDVRPGVGSCIKPVLSPFRRAPEGLGRVEGCGSAPRSTAPRMVARSFIRRSFGLKRFNALPSGLRPSCP